MHCRSRSLDRRCVTTFGHRGHPNQQKIISCSCFNLRGVTGLQGWFFFLFVCFLQYYIWALCARGKKNYFINRSVDFELRSLTAWGMKLLCSLMEQQQILLHLSPDGSRVNRLWLGQGWSFCIPSVSCRHLTSPTSLMLCRWVPVIRCGALLSWVVYETVPVCDVSSQDAFYCSSVKVDQNLALEFSWKSVGGRAYFILFFSELYCLYYVYLKIIN